MSGLSSELYNRCRETLLKCSELDSNAALRAVFVTTELRPFQGRVPDATNKQERVTLCLDFLLSKYLSDGRSLLPIFLAVLRDRYHEGDALRVELAMLCIQVGQELDNRKHSQPGSKQLSGQQGWNTAAIRELLSAAFDDEGLTNLSFDYFNSVYDTFSVGMSRNQKIQRLIEYCIRQDQIEKLLSVIKKHNPTKYTRYESKLWRKDI